MPVLDDAKEMGEDLAVLRHALHREPEIGLTLPRTQDTVLGALEGLPLEITPGKNTTSVTAVLRGTAPDRNGAVLLRGDMDALPVQEMTDLPWRSTIDGAMHACGHDLHVSMLIGCARLLCAQRDRLAGDVVFMFQPGEEGWDGASVMLDEGVLDAAGRRVDAAFGMHVFSAMRPRGQFVTRPGTMLSASDALDVTVHGAGGHGSAPCRAKDPVPAVAEMITALQTMVTRQFDIFDPVVLSVGSLHAGHARNVIPETAELTATVRTFSTAARERMTRAVPRLLEGIAAAHGVDVDVRYNHQYPLTVNDVEATSFAAGVVNEVFDGSRHSLLADPFSGSEDFSRVLAVVPGSFIGLGATPTGMDPETAPFNHSPYAQYDDSVLPDGAALYAELALRRLGSPLASSPAKGQLS
ncbi:MAG: M20 metallopeptidase family protein [Sciscionella sp.]